MERNLYSVSDFLAVFNQVAETAFPVVDIEGEVASFKVNQGKYVFFDVKDSSGSLNCFMTLWQLRTPIEDGMKVIVTATPKLTAWGKFSLTVRAIRPSGEGAIKKSFELLKQKLADEGLFDEVRKRPLPAWPKRVAVISSTQAAGYADFMRIVDDRWAGLELEVANVQVQGAAAPDQIINALSYFNGREDLPEVIVIIRGGGSADDLAAFNDEKLARAIAASRVPTLVGVGHETDESLADLVADRRAATPSNAAQILVPDKAEVARGLDLRVRSVLPPLERAIDRRLDELSQAFETALTTVARYIDQKLDQVTATGVLLAELNPQTVLARGYALLRGQAAVGETVELETSQVIMKAEVKNVRKK